MLNRNQGQIIGDALRTYVEAELTPEQRSVVEDMIRHSKPEDPDSVARDDSSGREAVA
jgi:hypothetical protein